MGKNVGEMQVVLMGASMELLLVDGPLTLHGETLSQTRWTMLQRDPQGLVGHTDFKLPSNCSSDNGGHCIVPLAQRIHWECWPWMLVVLWPI